MTGIFVASGMWYLWDISGCGLTSHDPWTSWSVGLVPLEVSELGFDLQVIWYFNYKMCIIRMSSTHHHTQQFRRFLCLDLASLRNPSASGPRSWTTSTLLLWQPPPCRRSCRRGTWGSGGNRGRSSGPCPWRSPGRRRLWGRCLSAGLWSCQRWRWTWVRPMISECSRKTCQCQLHF